MGRCIPGPFKIVPEISGTESARKVRARYIRNNARRCQKANAKKKLEVKRQKILERQRENQGKPRGTLNFREEWFCRYYIESRGVVCASALRAGYANKYMGSILLGLPKIQNRIRELQDESLRKNEMNIQNVMGNLSKFANREVANDPGNDRNTIAANVEIAKMLGAYTEKVRLENGDAGNAVSLSDLNLPVEIEKQLLAAIRDARVKKELAKAQVEADDDEEDDDEDEEELRQVG